MVGWYASGEHLGDMMKTKRSKHFSGATGKAQRPAHRVVHTPHFPTKPKPALLCATTNRNSANPRRQARKHTRREDAKRASGWRSDTDFAVSGARGGSWHTCLRRNSAHRRKRTRQNGKRPKTKHMARQNHIQKSRGKTCFWAVGRLFVEHYLPER